MAATSLNRLWGSIVARARNLKPGLFKNELLGVADPLLTILFESLWCLADREGRLEDRPLRIKAETFPYRDGLDVNGYLTELERLRFICRYQVDGEPYIQVLNFHKHQNPHKTERASEIPEMLEESGSCALTVKAPLENGSRPADSLVLIPSTLIPDLLIPDASPSEQSPDLLAGFDLESPVPRNGDRRKPVGEADPVLTVFQHWQTVLDHPSAKLDDRRIRNIKARLKTFSVADLCLAVDGCKLSPHHMGQNETGTVYDDIELICRNVSKVEAFIAIAKRPPRKPASKATAAMGTNAQPFDDPFARSAP